MADRHRLLPTAARLGCLLLFSACLAGALALSHGAPTWTDLRSLLAMRVKLGNVFIFLFLLLIASAVFSGPARLFESHRLATWQRRCGEALLAATLMAWVVGIAGWPLSLDFATPSFLVVFWTLLAGSLIASREVAQLALRFARSRGRNLRQVVLVAGAESSKRLVELLTLERPSGFRVAAVLRPTADPARLLAKLHTVIGNQPVDEVFISVPMDREQPMLAQLLDVCDQEGILVRVHVLNGCARLSQLQLDRLVDVPLLTLRPGPPEGWQMLAKRLVDLSGAILLLGALLPVLILISVALKLDSPGPVLFRQTRLGRNKRRFSMFKFRTMVADAEQRLAELEAFNDADGPVFKIRHDPRVTQIGYWLRRFSLDELPQLVNVIRGEMSLVGPRPLPPRDVERISAAWHRRRFSVQPGLTCLWQVSGRSDLSFDRWIRLDLEYIDQWSLLLDLKILWRTLPAVVRGAGAY